MSVRLAPFIALVCGVMAFCSTSLRADEPPPAHEAAPSAAATSSVDAALVKLTPEQLEKKKRAYIGLVALAGIVIVGVALGALTILWAGRLRRQLRRADPECAPLDRSFWFLRPPKPLVTRSSLPELQRLTDVPPPLTPPPSDPLPPSEPQ